MINRFPSSEREFIKYLARKFPLTHPEVKLGLGDDAAVLHLFSEKAMLITVDTLVGGVHFHDIPGDYYNLGRKSLLVNLSDIAAMGAIPRCFLLSMVIPPRFDPAKLEDLLNGMAQEAKENDLVLLGGDSVGGDNLILSITMLGAGNPEQLLSRGEAQVGEGVYLTGQVGESAAGLRFIREDRNSLAPSKLALIERHLLPPNRVGLCQFITTHFSLSSLIDLSDGLSEGLKEISIASGVGFLCEWERIPISDALRDNFKEADIEELCLYGGEDYELLFTAPLSLSKKITAEVMAEFNLAVTLIGEVKDADFGIQLKKDGHTRELAGSGFEHFHFPGA